MATRTDVGARQLPVGEVGRVIGIVSARDVLDVLLTAERRGSA